MSENTESIEELRETNERLKLKLDNLKMTQALEGWENKPEVKKQRTLKEIQKEFRANSTNKDDTLIGNWKKGRKQKNGNLQSE